MSIALTYGEIATLEEQLNAESRFLDEKEKWLTDQLLGAPDWKNQIERAVQLTGVQTLKAILPERQRRLKAQIFALQSQIERTKQQ